MSCAGVTVQGTGLHVGPQPPAASPASVCSSQTASCTAWLRGQGRVGVPPHPLREPHHCGRRWPQRYWLCLPLWSLVRGAAGRGLWPGVGCPEEAGPAWTGSELLAERRPLLRPAPGGRTAASRVGPAASLVAGVGGVPGEGTALSAEAGGRGTAGVTGAGRGVEWRVGSRQPRSPGVNERGAGGASVWSSQRPLCCVQALQEHSASLFLSLLAEQPLAVHTVTSSLSFAFPC